MGKLFKGSRGGGAEGQRLAAPPAVDPEVFSRAHHLQMTGGTGFAPQPLDFSRPGVMQQQPAGAPVTTTAADSPTGGALGNVTERELPSPEDEFRRMFQMMQYELSKGDGGA